MFSRVQVVGHGRLGSAVSARLAERGMVASGPDADLVLLCVPDRVIHEVAEKTPQGPWIAHMSGAVPLAALAPHTRRFGVHPLQTFRVGGGPEQLDGASAAITAELATGKSLLEAVHAAKDFVTAAIAHGLRLGKGTGICDPLALED